MSCRHCIYKAGSGGINPRITQPWGKGSVFIPTSMCGQPPGTCALPELIEVVLRWLRVLRERGCLVGPAPPFPNSFNNGTSVPWWTWASVCPPGCSHTTLQSLQAVFMQPTPVLSLDLSSEAQVSALSPCVHQWTHVSGWGEQGYSTDHLRRSLSILPFTNWLCALLWASEAPFLPQLISLQVKGLHRVWEPFLLHSSLPGAQVLSWSPPFISFILPGYMEISPAILGVWDLLPVFSRHFVRVFSTCRCIFAIFVGRGKLHILLFCHLDWSPHASNSNTREYPSCFTLVWIEYYIIIL